MRVSFTYMSCRFTRRKSLSLTFPRFAEESLVQRHNEKSCLELVQLFLEQVPQHFLQRFCRLFMLQSNQTSVRWQAHAFLLHVYR